MNSPVRNAALIVVLTLAAGTANAGTASSNLGVSSTVTNNCLIDTTPVAFGNYDPISANASSALGAEGAVTVTCTNGATVTVTLGQGANAGAGSTEGAPIRRMRAGATSNYLSYALYQDSGNSSAWGNTSPTGVESTGTGTAVEISVHGSVAAAQNVPAAAYADTVIATVTF